MSFDDIPFMAPTPHTTDITTAIIGRCEEMLNNNPEYVALQQEGLTFGNIIPYGDPKNPCFIANHIFKFINPKEQNVHRNLKKYYILTKHYFKAKLEEDSKVYHNMLTRKGIMKAMYRGKTLLAETFQDFIFDLLDNLLLNEFVIMEKQIELTQKNTEERMREEVRIAQEKARIAELSAKRANEEHIITNEKLLKEQDHSKSLDVANCNIILTKAEEYKKLSVGYLHNVIPNEDMAIKELNILQFNTMKPYPVYAVSIGLIKEKYLKPVKLSSKNVRKKDVPHIFNQYGMSDSDSDGEEVKIPLKSTTAQVYTNVYDDLNQNPNIIKYNYREINMETLKDAYDEQDNEFYVYISSTPDKVNNKNDKPKPHELGREYHLAGYIYLWNQKHYNDTMSILKHGEALEKHELPTLIIKKKNENQQEREDRKKVERLYKKIQSDNKKLEAFEKNIEDPTKIFTIDRKTVIKTSYEQLVNARHEALKINEAIQRPLRPRRPRQKKTQ